MQEELGTLELNIVQDLCVSSIVVLMPVGGVPIWDGMINGGSDASPSDWSPVSMKCGRAMWVFLK